MTTRGTGIAAGFLITAFLVFCAAAAGGPLVEVRAREQDGYVDVVVDGKPFTTYRFDDGLKKPVLHPLRTDRGTVVTRGFPLAPRAGERVDHPHQVGLWFNHGDVNGLDFWNNSDQRRAQDAALYGTIRNRKILRTESAPERGELVVAAEWLTSDGRPLLHEETRFVSHARSNARLIDRITKLTARGERVLFRDNKEGLLGIRVCRALEHASDEPALFVGLDGKPEQAPRVDKTDVTGRYRSSEGVTGEAIWGTRGRWLALTGSVDDEIVTIAILDHPGNPGYPTYWHARGYGLLAANPLGQAVFTGEARRVDLTLQPGESVVFRHRIALLSQAASAEEMDALHRRFLDETD